MSRLVAAAPGPVPALEVPGSPLRLDGAADPLAIVPAFVEHAKAPRSHRLLVVILESLGVDHKPADREGHGEELVGVVVGRGRQACRQTIPIDQEIPQALVWD